MVTMALLLCAGGASAVALWHEPFSYSNGALVDVSGGKWTTHSGTTGQVSVLAGRVLLRQSDSEDVSAVLPGQPFAATSDTVLYARLKFSFTNLPSASGTYFAHFKDGTASGFRSRIFALTSGAAPGRYRIGIANGANNPAAVVPLDLHLDMEYALVVRYVVSNATSTLWLNPTTESDPSVVAGDPAAALLIRAFALRQADGMGGVFVDELTVGVTFADVYAPPPVNPPRLLEWPANRTVAEGSAVSFGVQTAGSEPLTYQWQFNDGDLAGATNATIELAGVAADDSGNYSVRVSNAAGTTNSPAAMLIVLPPPEGGTISLVTYNVKGNFASDWTTNAAQVQAIGRQMMYLAPDIITFNEIPNSRTYEMTNFVNVFLPGYFLATNSATDGAIRSVVASRYPITRSQAWLAGASLTNFGYEGTFTRDLFEAEIEVPGATEPLHVFTTHLKSGTDSASVARRAAEASAVSNFFVTVFIPGNGSRPYVLTGDLNEDIDRPHSGSQQPIHRLIAAATGLQLTTPINPFTANELTFSIQSASGLTRRYDYILPSGLLFSNMAEAKVFRTGVLPELPPPLLADDDYTASDHLPVMMVFYYPDPPLRATQWVSNDMIVLRWPTLLGRRYNVESATDLAGWSVAVSNLIANSTQETWSTNLTGAAHFYRIVRVP